MASELTNRQEGTSYQKPSKKGDVIKHRAEQYRDSKFRSADIKLSLMDIDTVIVDYFENAIKPEVIDSTGQRVQVPIMYGNPERWATVQKSRVYRDSSGKMQLPLIMFKRTGIEKERTLGRKMDANSPKLYQGFTNGYTKVNAYDNFRILQGINPKKEMKRVVIPDYINLSYDVIVTTEFLEQMNGIVEAINYAEGSYWGRKEKYNFKSKIDSFDNVTEVASGEDRINTVNFSLTLSGFLIPDVLQKKINSESSNVVTGALSVMIGENVDSETISETFSELDLNAESGNTNGGYHPISNIPDRFKLK